MKCKHSVLLLALIALFNYCYSAQRMGLPKGSYGAIPPGKSGQIKSYCMDQHDPAPSPNDLYSKQLSRRKNDVVVKFGNNTPIPLIDAIKAGKIKLSGDSSGYNNLKIENLSDEPAQITVKEFSIFGQEGHKPFDYDTSIFNKIADNENLWDVQRQIYEKKCNAITKKYSDNKKTYFNFFLNDEKAKINFNGKDIELSVHDLIDLQNGKPLPEEHPLSAHLHENLNINFIMHKHEDMVNKINYDRFVEKTVYGMVKAYPDTSFFRDPLNSSTGNHVNMIETHEINASSSIKLFLDEEKSFNTTDWNTIQNIKSALVARGWDNSNFYYVNKDVKLIFRNDGKQLIIVITGHIDDNLSALVEYLGKAGVFRGNFAVMNTCNQPLSSRLAEKIVFQYGALGVYSFKGDQKGRIESADVQEYIMKMAEHLKSRGRFDLKTIFKSIINECGLIGIWKVDNADFERLFAKG